MPRCLPAGALFGLLLASAGAEPEQEPRRVLEAALDPADVQGLQELLNHGASAACCGSWRDAAAARLQHRIAAELNVSERRLSDVHVANSTMWVRAGAQSSQWGAVAVLYLDQPSDARVSFEQEDGRRVAAVAQQGAALIAPDGEQLVHEAPRRVAWLRVRREGAPDRSSFEFYVASGIRRSFVAPYDTAPQRKFFRAHTRDPMYWHGFFWSFVGMFCTVFACLPLAWWGVQLVEQWLSRNTVEEKPAVRPTPKALDPPSRKSSSDSLDMSLRWPGTPQKLPTLLPLAMEPPARKSSSDNFDMPLRRPSTPMLPTLLPHVGRGEQHPASGITVEKLAAGAPVVANSPCWA